MARLWASRKVAYLLDDIRLHGEHEGRLEELVALARRYGIVTPYTSYLADPAALASGSQAADEVSMARQAMPELRAESGARAVGTGRALDAMKLSLDAASPQAAAPSAPRRDAGAGAAAHVRSNAEPNAAPVRWVAGRAFYLRGETWTDAAWPADTGDQRVLRLRAFGTGWSRFIVLSHQAAEWAALGERVRMRIGSVLVEISPEGADDVAAADWAALRAAARARGN